MCVHVGGPCCLPMSLADEISVLDTPFQQVLSSGPIAGPEERERGAPCVCAKARAGSL